LRRLGHDLKAVVLVGNAGLSANVLTEIERALADHELIKVRVRASARGDRDGVIAHIGMHTGAELVQRVGHVALFYRRNPEKAHIPLDDGIDADSAGARSESAD
jgi:RNA-binding protein